MRPIKFKIWDKNRSCWDKYAGMQVLHHDEPLKQSGKEYVQFTGLIDINGKDIFEGDIVKSVDDATVELFSTNVKYTKGIVTWIYGGFKIIQKDINSTHISAFIVNNQCTLEVIGNKFENVSMVE